jgi:hypothetical protein
MRPYQFPRGSSCGAATTPATRIGTLNRSEQQNHGGSIILVMILPQHSADWFIERPGVRGEKLKQRPMSRADLQEDRPHLTLPSPLPPGAENEDIRALVVHLTVCSVVRAWVWVPTSTRTIDEDEGELPP